jgi:hypothetical protein
MYRDAQELHASRMDDHRRRAEELGKLHISLARNMAVFAANCLIEMQRHREATINLKPGEPRPAAPYLGIASLTRLASTSAQLAQSGIGLEGQALGIDDILEVVEAIRAKDAMSGGAFFTMDMAEGDLQPLGDS